MQFEPFGPAHVPAAARLIANRHAATRERVPALPSRWEQASLIEPLLGRLAEVGGGVVARDGDDLVGHLVGRLIDADGPHAWAYVPDIGFAIADRPDRRRIAERLYALAARDWVTAGVRTHRIALPADDSALLEAFGCLSFGRLVVDAIRTLEPVVVTPPPGVVIRRGTLADLPPLIELEAALLRHLLASPIFLVRPPDDPAELRARLADPAVAHLFAEVDGHPVAYVRIQPCADDVATMARDPRTASITGAYTLREHRGAGVARSLVAAAIEWARSEGYLRCAVDFETMNAEAARFWPIDFRPVSVVMTRTIDDRASAPDG